MSRLDDALKQALRRREPPEGFAERVLARAAEQPVRRSRWEVVGSWFRMPRWQLAGAVAALVLIVGGSQYYREQQQRVQGEEAREQVLLALRIAANELHVAQQKVLRISFTDGR